MRLTYLQTVALAVLFVVSMESLVSALVIQLLMRLLSGMAPPYGRAYRAAFISGVLVYAVTCTMGVVATAFHLGISVIQGEIIADFAAVLIMAVIYARFS